MCSERGSEHELRRSDCRTGRLTVCEVQGKRRPGQFLGFRLRCRGPGGTYHVRHPAGNMGLNRSLFFQLDNMLQAPLSSRVPASRVQHLQLKPSPNCICYAQNTPVTSFFLEPMLLLM